MSIQSSAQDDVQALARAAEDLAVADLPDQEERAGDTAIEALRRMHERLGTEVRDLRQVVLNAVEGARARLDAVAASPDAAAWREAVAASEREYQDATRQLSSAGFANPDEYRDLLQRTATLEQEIRALEQRKSELQEREKEAASALERYREIRVELTARRRAFALRSSTASIRVEIRGNAERDDLELFLRETLGIRRFDADHGRLAKEVDPTPEGDWAFHPLDNAVSRLRAFLANPQAAWHSEDKRFDEALRRLQPERIDRLALYLPGDAVDVSFQDTGQWRKLSHGSPGQQTAALLAFVLGFGNEPIILDQPEDDLDSTLIYELLVKRLRDNKQIRQIVVVTHNPNIVVHGDAELVISLVTKKGQTRITCSGGLQERRTREEICRVMEGGRDAFEARYRRIMQPAERRHGQP